MPTLLPFRGLIADPSTIEGLAAPVGLDVLLAARALVRDERPVLYRYVGSTPVGGRERERRGFVALLPVDAPITVVAPPDEALGSATLAADFTNNTVVSTLNVTVAGNNWIASGPGVIGAQAGLPAHQFEGIYNNVQINPIQGTGTGTFSGFFSGPATGTGGAPAGAGLSFNLNDNQGLGQVNGVAALIAP